MNQFTQYYIKTAFPQWASSLGKAVAHPATQTLAGGTAGVAGAHYGAGMDWSSSAPYALTGAAIGNPYFRNYVAAKELAGQGGVRTNAILNRLIVAGGAKAVAPAAVETATRIPSILRNIDTVTGEAASGGWRATGPNGETGSIDPADVARAAKLQKWKSPTRPPVTPLSDEFLSKAKIERTPGAGAALSAGLSNLNDASKNVVSGTDAATKTLQNVGDLSASAKDVMKVVGKDPLGIKPVAEGVNSLAGTGNRIADMMQNAGDYIGSHGKQIGYGAGAIGGGLVLAKLIQAINSRPKKKHTEEEE